MVRYKIYGHWGPCLSLIYFGMLWQESNETDPTLPESKRKEERRSETHIQRQDAKKKNRKRNGTN